MIIAPIWVSAFSNHRSPFNRQPEVMPAIRLRFSESAVPISLCGGPLSKRSMPIIRRINSAYSGQIFLHLWFTHFFQQLWQVVSINKYR